MNAPKPHPLAIRLGAEFLVIVFGVLIALWTNEWWANRAERLEESEILNAILEDVIASQKLLRSDLEFQERVLNQVLAVSGGSGGAASKLSASEFEEAIYGALWETPQFHLQMSAYEEIKNSGRLRLLEDPELRRGLAEFDATVGRVQSMVGDEMQHQQTKLDAYAIENADMPGFSQYALRNVQGADPVPPSDEQIDHRALLESRVFKNLIATKYFLMQNGHERAEQLYDILVALEALLQNSVRKPG